MAYVAESFPLKNGMKGTNTKLLQQKLGVNADGYFGEATETALKRAYGVTSCSQELFTKITNNSNKKGDMTLTEDAKKKLKVGGLIVGGVGLAFGLYKLITNASKKKALNGVRRRRKARKSSKSLKVINLQ